MMNTKKLIYIDTFFSVVLNIVAIILRTKNILLKKYKYHETKEKILIIKFLGSGNFLAIADVLSKLDCTIITAKSNVQTINKFIVNADVIVINEKNIRELIITIFCAVLKLLMMRFSKVVNLEAESSFAKLITTIPYSDNVSGLSNNYKNILDNFYYDYYLVSPVNLNRNRILTLLLNIDQPSVNEINLNQIESINESIHKLKTEFKDKVVVAPTCSLTDKNRRLNILIWRDILFKISSIYKEVDIIFPSELDQQYNEFSITVSKMKLENLHIIISNYNEFVDQIIECDLLITIDSQALHLGQYYNKYIICFYGPTSPHGVRLNNRTYSVTKEMECSPCTHKYFVEPCRGKLYCMKYSANEIDRIIEKVLK